MKKLKIENEWSDSIDASKVEGAVSRIEVGEVLCAMNRMRIRKASGPSEFCYRIIIIRIRLVGISV